MSFRHKLLGAFLGLLGVILGLSLLTIQRSETRRAEAEVRAGLELTRVLFTDLLSQRDRELAGALRLLSSDFAFKQALATMDPRTVRSVADNHRARMGADVMIIAAADGRTLADTRPGKAKAGQPMPFIRKALEGKPVSGVYVLEGVPYLLACLPVNTPDAIGAIAAGFKIEDKLAHSLRRLTLSEVAFLTSGRIVGSTLAPERATELLSQAGTVTAEPRILRIGGERFLAASPEPREPVQAIVLKSWDQAMVPLRIMRRRVLLIGLGGLAAAAGLGLLIAAGITASLDKLVEAAAGIAAGHYDVRVDIRSRDEFGRLGKAFSDMARGLLERERIRSILNKTVSKEIAEALVSKGAIELGGEEREVTVLFSDIRSFTTVSESLLPRDLVAQLNEYFGGMARAVEEHHGVIDKYIGDAVMALFGAPVSAEGDAANALRAALAMLRALDALNVRRAGQGLPAWRIGIGINTGPVVAGTIGSEDRLSYTVIGDAVNLASRLESETKNFDAKIIVSAAAKRLAGPGFTYRALGAVTVKGKTEAVEIFELLGT